MSLCSRNVAVSKTGIRRSGILSENKLSPNQALLHSSSLRPPQSRTRYELLGIFDVVAFIVSHHRHRYHLSPLGNNLIVVQSASCSTQYTLQCAVLLENFIEAFDASAVAIESYHSCSPTVRASSLNRLINLRKVINLARVRDQ